jgi:hypothetical protein
MILQGTQPDHRMPRLPALMRADARWKPNALTLRQGLLHPRIQHLWHEHESLNVGAAGCVACPCSIASAVWSGSSRAGDLSQIASGDDFYAAFPDLIARTKGLH